MRSATWLPILAAVVTTCGGGPATMPPPLPLADRIVFTIDDIPGDPDWMATGFDAVWLKRDDGKVMRIDPATADVLATIDADVNGEGLCQGLGVDSTSIWTCTGNDVVRIDPATNAVAAVIPADKIFVQGRLVFGGNKVWIITGNADQLAGLDILTNEVGPATPLGAECHDLAAGAGSLWATCPPSNLILRISSEDGSVMDRFEVTSPGPLSVSTDAAWVGTPTGIVRIDLDDRESRVVAPSLVPGDFGTILATPDGIWVRTHEPFLARIDPTTLTVTEQLTTDAYGTGEVVELNGTLWTSDSENGAVVAVRATP